MRHSLEDLCGQLGIVNIPGTWVERWPGFEDWADTDGCGELRWELTSDAAEVFGLPDDALPLLQSMFKVVSEDSRLRVLAEFWHYMIYHLPEGMERNSNVWGLPDHLLGHSTRLFSLAAMVSGCEHAAENFRKTELSSEIALASLGYIGRYAMDIKEKRGVWGLESIGWLSNYVRGKVFRLGRLSFKAGESPLPFRIMENILTGDVVILCEPTFKYRGDGITDGTEGIFDPDAWSPVLTLDGDLVKGNPVVEGPCVADRNVTSLSKSEWREVLAPNDPIVEVHVAAGSPLDYEECVESFRRAVEFFPTFYSETEFKGFTCSSWLLDPGLPQILSPESNIVKFQRFFHTVPVLTSGAQAYDAIFGSADVDLTRVVPKTRLQKAILSYVSAGNPLRPASGFILWEEAKSLGKGHHSSSL